MTREHQSLNITRLVKQVSVDRNGRENMIVGRYVLDARQKSPKNDAHLGGGLGVTLHFCSGWGA